MNAKIIVNRLVDPLELEMELSEVPVVGRRLLLHCTRPNHLEPTDDLYLVKQVMPGNPVHGVDLVVFCSELIPLTPADEN